MFIYAQTERGLVSTGKINATNYNTVSLDDWMDYFDGIFDERNENTRQKNKESARFMWLKVIEHSTRIAEAIRKSEFFEAVSSVAKVFCWTCGFVKNNAELLGTGNTHTPLSDILWHKYPRACGYCAPPMDNTIKETIRLKQALRCSCEPSKEKMEDKKADAPHLDDYRKSSENYLRPPHSLDDWSQMFRGIYLERYSLMNLDSICFHFLEEVGEVLTKMQMIANFSINFPPNTPVDHIREKTIFKRFFAEIIKNPNATYDDFVNSMKLSLQDEIADVLSWLFSLVEKLFMERESFSTYERNVGNLIKENPELKAFSRILGHNILRSLPDKEESRILNFASIIYVFYSNGCTVCGNLSKDFPKCQCKMKIPPTFIM